MPEDPTCRLITVSVSARADDRLPVVGEDRRQLDPVWALGQRDRPEAALCVAPDLLRPDLGVGQPGDAHGDDPLGVGRVPLLEQPVVPGAVTASPSSASEHCEKTRPQKPVIIDGKLSDAHTPLMSMSWMRASMSQQPRRIWSNRKGSTFTDSGLRPATAFMPTCV